jgi:hypothetical protein
VNDCDKCKSPTAVKDEFSFVVQSRFSKIDSESSMFGRRISTLYTTYKCDCGARWQTIQDFDPGGRGFYVNPLDRDA